MGSAGGGSHCDRDSDLLLREFEARENMKNPTSSFLTFDLLSKVVISFLSVGYIHTAQSSNSKEIVLLRFIWLPEVIICVLLILSNLASQLLLRGKKDNGGDDKKYVFGDVFILTTLDKLISIGYNAHLVIFFITRRDIDIAYMVLPVLVFLYYILDSGVVEWQQRILRFWSVGHIQTNLVIQHLLCMFFY